MIWFGLAMAMVITTYIFIPWNKSEAHVQGLDCQETAVRWWWILTESSVNSISWHLYIITLGYGYLYVIIPRIRSQAHCTELQSCNQCHGEQVTRALGDDAVNSKVWQVSPYRIWNNYASNMYPQDSSLCGKSNLDAKGHTYSWLNKLMTVSNICTARRVTRIWTQGTMSHDLEPENLRVGKPEDQLVQLQFLLRSESATGLQVA